ncbi:hypothetical protein TWF481_001761 [Arthrobotrys musiformis]|uniref:Uncharacterized protein n=1 Tax=Arthrobotrys musiformis TaxID=47236 RepID=A0AAV9VVS5_9PEZI
MRKADLESLYALKDSDIGAKSPMGLELSAGDTKFGPFMIAIGDAIRKGAAQSSLVTGGRDQWGRNLANQSSQNPPTSAPLSPEQVSSSPRPKTSTSDGTYSDTRDSQSTGQQD